MLNQAANAVAVIGSALQPEIICLGETDIEAATRLCRSLPAHYRLFSFDGDHAGPPFGICLAWNTVSLRYVAHTCHTDVIASKRRKICIRIQLELEDGTPLTLFALHWPSRIREPEESHARADISQKLRRLIDDDLAMMPDCHLIVLGDFNDDPYNLSVSRHLQATRDLKRARENANLLYNPFWYSLPNKRRYRAGERVEGSSGSCVHKRSAKETHRWHVFDQIIVSSAFLGASDWHLNEDETQVLDDPSFHGILLAPNSKFDHYPVTALFERGGGA